MRFFFECTLSPQCILCAFGKVWIFSSFSVGLLAVEQKQSNRLLASVAAVRQRSKRANSVREESIHTYTHTNIHTYIPTYMQRDAVEAGLEIVHSDGAGNRKTWKTRYLLPSLTLREFMHRCAEVCVSVCMYIWMYVKRRGFFRLELSNIRSKRRAWITDFRQVQATKCERASVRARAPARESPACQLRRLAKRWIKNYGKTRSLSGHSQSSSIANWAFFFLFLVNFFSSLRVFCSARKKAA